MSIFFNFTIYNTKNYKTDSITIPKTNNAGNIDEAIRLIKNEYLKGDQYIAVAREWHEYNKKRFDAPEECNRPPIKISLIDYIKEMWFQLAHRTYD